MTKPTKLQILKSTLVLIPCLIVCLFCLVGCNFSNSDNTDGNTKLLSRSANNNDIYIDISQEFSLSINYVLKPNVDIDGLEITFTYYDKNQAVLTTKVKSVGNVKKGVEYTVSVSLTEFSLIQLLKFKTVSTNVTGGTVSYFQ